MVPPSYVYHFQWFAYIRSLYFIRVFSLPCHYTYIVQHEERVETDQADTMTEIPAKSDVVMVYATTAGKIVII